MKLIANLVEWSKWDLDTIMDMPFTPTMLIVNAVISEQQKKDSEDNNRPEGPKSGDAFNTLNTLHNIENYHKAEG